MSAYSWPKHNLITAFPCRLIEWQEYNKCMTSYDNNQSKLSFFLRNYYPISILFFFLCTNITKPISSNCLIQNVAYTYTNTFLLYIVRFSRDLYHSANASQRIMATTNISHEKCHICFLATSHVTTNRLFGICIRNHGTTKPAYG